MHLPVRLQPFAFAIVFTLLLAAFAAYDLWRERELALAQAESNTANLARLLEQTTRQSMRRIDTLLSAAEVRLAEDRTAPGKPPDRQALQQAVAPPLKGDGLVSALLWLDAAGQLRASTARPDQDFAAALQDWLSRRREGAPSATLTVGHQWQLAGGGWQLPVGRHPSRQTPGGDGTLLAMVDLRNLQAVFEAVDTGRNGFVTLFTTDGWLLATAPHNETLFARNWGSAPMFTEHLPRSPTGTVQQVVVRDGTERVYTYRALPEYGMVISAGISLTDALADWRARVGWDATLLALVGAISLWGATAMSRTYTRREEAERASAESARQTQAVLEHAADGILTHGPDGIIASANQASATMFGYAPGDLIGRPLSTVLPEPLCMATAPAGSTADADASRRSERHGLRRDGSEFPIEIAVTEVPRAGQRLRIVLVHDITERQRAQSALSTARDTAERSERFLRHITDNLPMRIGYVDRERRYRFVNLGKSLRWQRPREEILGRTRQELSGSDLGPEWRARIEAVLGGQAQRFEMEEDVAGARRIVETILVPDRDPERDPDSAPDGGAAGFFEASTDVTERHAQQRRIERALAERETLLREVYHRVKNNLQVIQSLLNLQRRTLPEGLAREALQESVQRVHAMALVHEKLYQSGDLDTISLRDYSTDLLRHLGETAGAGQRRVQLQADIEPLNVALERAVPFGLLLTELVSNAFKHGFPAGRGGTIRVCLHQEPVAVVLQVRDDGVGLPQDFTFDGGPTMGLQLAASLAGQLGGTLQASAAPEGPGALFTVRLERLC